MFSSNWVLGINNDSSWVLFFSNINTFVIPKNPGYGKAHFPGYGENSLGYGSRHTLGV